MLYFSKIKKGLQTMKKKLISILIIFSLNFIIMLPLSYGQIHENDKLKIEIPNEFVLESGGLIEIYGRLPNEYPKVVLGVTNYKDSPIDISRMSEKNLKEYIKGFVDAINSNEYAKVSVIEYDIRKVSQYDCIYILGEYTTGIYVETRSIHSDNYSYSINVMSEARDYFNSIECKNMLDSLVIKDTMSNKGSNSAYDAGYATGRIITFAIIAYVIWIIIERIKGSNKRKK